MDLALSHQTVENIAFGIDVDYENDSPDISADYQYRGPTVLVGVYF